MKARQIEIDATILFADLRGYTGLSHLGRRARFRILDDFSQSRHLESRPLSQTGRTNHGRLVPYGMTRGQSEGGAGLRSTIEASNTISAHLVGDIEVGAEARKSTLPSRTDAEGGEVGFHSPGATADEILSPSVSNARDAVAGR